MSHQAASTWFIYYSMILWNKQTRFMIRFHITQIKTRINQFLPRLERFPQQRHCRISPFQATFPINLQRNAETTNRPDERLTAPFRILTLP